MCYRLQVLYEIENSFFSPGVCSLIVHYQLLLIILGIKLVTVGLSFEVSIN
jgi:hypothetical protein